MYLQVIVRSKDIRRDSRSEVTAILFLVSATTMVSATAAPISDEAGDALILNIHHPFRIRIA